MLDRTRDVAKKHGEHITLNLRQDCSGYYWEAENGEFSNTHYADASDAISRIIAMWSAKTNLEWFAEYKHHAKVA